MLGQNQASSNTDKPCVTSSGLFPTTSSRDSTASLNTPCALVSRSLHRLLLLPESLFLFHLTLHLAGFSPDIIISSARPVPEATLYSTQKILNIILKIVYLSIAPSASALIHRCIKAPCLGPCANGLQYC